MGLMSLLQYEKLSASPYAWQKSATCCLHHVLEVSEETAGQAEQKVLVMDNYWHGPFLWSYTFPTSGTGANLSAPSSARGAQSLQELGIACHWVHYLMLNFPLSLHCPLCNTCALLIPRNNHFSQTCPQPLL